MQQPSIEQLEQQLQQLNSQLQHMQQQLQQTQQQLQLLKGEAPAGVTAPAKPPAAPAAPGFNLENFIGLKFIHLAGIIVLVIGISIGVKYAIDQNLISPLARIVLAYLAGIALYVFSRTLKKGYAGFSAILFSGGMASLYFTTYAACVYYSLLPGWLAFVLMVGFTVYTTLMAISYDRQEIAILGMVGAYGIPFLISRNNDAIALFFAYILLTNLGVVYLSFKRSWKIMSELALLVTWLLFLGWHAVRNAPDNTALSFLFLLVFYALFQLSALGYSLLRKIALDVTVQLEILVNNAALYLGCLLVFRFMQVQDVGTQVTGIFTIIVFLMGLACYRLLRKEKALIRALFLQSFVLLIFFTLLEWSNFVLSLIWIGIACALFIAGVATRHSWPRLTAVGLFGITLLKLVAFDSTRFSTIEKISCYLVIGTLLLVVSFFYQKFKNSLFGSDEKNTEQGTGDHE